MQYVLYDPKNTYTTPDGQIYTNEMFLRDYPAGNVAKMAVMVSGTTIVSATTVSYLRGINYIDSDVSDEEALSIISYNEEKSRTESTTQERIASALEFIELLMMGDKT